MAATSRRSAASSSATAALGCGSAPEPDSGAGDWTSRLERMLARAPT